jgi:hypothetical protein
MARAIGDYIALSDQDDVWEADKIEQQMETIGGNWLVSCFSKPFAEGNVTAHFDHRKHLIKNNIQSLFSARTYAVA